MSTIKKIVSGILAGILISLGGTVLLKVNALAAADSPAKPFATVMGAIFFAIALLCICIKGFSLFTGKICYIPEKHDKEAFSILLLGLLGNLIGTFVCGKLMIYADPSLVTAAETMCSGKLANQLPLQTFIRAIFCGVIIYLAVDIFRKKDRLVAILFGIPVFILSAYEHSIADMYYFAASNIVSWQAFGFIWIVIAGNSVGGMLLPLLEMIGKKEK